MEKKYQFFISSTYEDLKAERQKAIETILTMNQFPAGMEMFSAANEEQWEIIKETIDCSDYYVLIVGNKYGSIDPASGSSYTEKEFDYAVRQKIPVLAFVIANDVSTTADNLEKDPVKAAGLLNFKSKVIPFRELASAPFFMQDFYILHRAKTAFHLVWMLRQ